MGQTVGFIADCSHLLLPHMIMIPIEDLVDITIISQSANPERLKDYVCLHEIQSERMRQVARILMKDLQPEEASPEARRLARLLQTRDLAEFERDGSSEAFRDQ